AHSAGVGDDARLLLIPPPAPRSSRITALGLAVALIAATATGITAARLRRANDRADFYRGQAAQARSEEHTSELQSRFDLVCRLRPAPTLFPRTALFRSGSLRRSWRRCSAPLDPAASPPILPDHRARPRGRPHRGDGDGDHGRSLAACERPRGLLPGPGGPGEIGRAHV